MNTVLQLIVNGILAGGIYAVIAMGLTLIFGVMNVVNFAHGEILMISMYATFWLNLATGMDPYLSIIIIFPLLFLIGGIIQRILIHPVLNAPHETQIFITLGLLIVLQNLALLLWSPNYRVVRVEYALKVLRLGEINVPLGSLIAFVVALLLTLGLFLFLKKTFIGKAIRAISQDMKSASLMGVNVRRLYVIAFGIGCSCVGVAGAAMVPIYPTYPTVGLAFVLITFVVVVLGGLGSLTGALIGGVIIGIVEAFSAYYLSQSLSGVILFLLFIVILIFKPKGIMGTV